MSKKILTLDNLYQFFVQQNKNVNFNAKETHSPIVVSIPATFEEVSNDMQGMLKLKLKVCHIDTNRNGSHISKENMERAMPSLKYRPLLAYIHQLKDGTWDFYAHNMEIVEDENGDEQIHYLEKQVGCFTADPPYLEYDKDMDKTYVYAYGVVPEDYTMTADIIRRKNGTRVSCELVIDELYYNAKEKYLDLIDFYFGATTFLGCDENGNEIGEGMLGSRADISDFCHKEPIFNYQDRLIETLDKLNFTLENFNKTSKEKGGTIDMNMFEQLLAKYNKTVEDVTFETEGLSDEELEAKFEEVFGDAGAIKKKGTGDGISGGGEEGTADSDDEDEDAGEGEGAGTDDDDIDDDDNVNDNGGGDNGDDGETGDMACKKKKKCSIDESGLMSLIYEISHEDIRYGLYNLLCQYDELDNDWYFITNVYDDYFVFENWDGNKCYKQNYKVDGDTVSFEGERVELFKELLTASEKATLDDMRKNYAALVEFKANTEASELQAKKDAIFAKAEYDGVKETKSFKKLVADSKNYSVEECEQKANDILEDFNSFALNFSVDTDKKPKAMHFATKTVDKVNKKPYGDLFPDK